MRDLRSFRRFELKFVVPELAAVRLHQALDPWMFPDPVADGAAYNLESLYYDTTDLRFYWEKVDGLRLRRKLRIRRYVDDAPAEQDTEVYLEIKQRLDRVTQKRRVKLSLGEAGGLLDRGRPGGDSIGRLGDRDPVLEEICVLTTENELQPTLVTGYNRTALVGGVNDPGLRVTFDRDCYYRSIDPSLVSTSREGLLLPPGWVIVEIKVNDRLPAWLSRLIAAEQLSLTRISKYVQGVERAELAPRSVFFHDTDRPLTRSIHTYSGKNQ